MAQDYDNIRKKLWADHAEELSRFVLGADDVEVLTDLGTEDTSGFTPRNLCLWWNSL